MCALVLTIWQANRVIRHQQISVSPLLDSWLHTSDNEIHFWIANKGLGTAIIKRFSFLINGDELTNASLKSALAKLPFSMTYDSHIGELYNVKSYIAKDEKVDLLKLKVNGDADIDEIEKFLKTLITVDIEYQSLYGKKSLFQIRNGQHV